jgi:hypothetical protein
MIIAAATATLSERRPGRIGTMDLLRHAGRFAPEKNDVARAESEAGIGRRGFRCREHEAKPALGAKRLEGAPGRVARDVEMLKVVEPGAAEVAVGDVEAGRLDDVDLNAKAGRQAQHGAGVLRDVGLVESKAHAPSSCDDGAPVKWPAR